MSVGAFLTGFIYAVSRMLNNTAWLTEAAIRVYWQNYCTATCIVGGYHTLTGWIHSKVTRVSTERRLLVNKRKGSRFGIDFIGTYCSRNLAVETAHLVHSI